MTTLCSAIKTAGRVALSAHRSASRWRVVGGIGFAIGLQAVMGCLTDPPQPSSAANTNLELAPSGVSPEYQAFEHQLAQDSFDVLHGTVTEAESAPCYLGSELPCTISKLNIIRSLNGTDGTVELRTLGGSRQVIGADGAPATVDFTASNSPIPAVGEDVVVFVQLYRADGAGPIPRTLAAAPQQSDFFGITGLERGYVVVDAYYVVIPTPA